MRLLILILVFSLYYLSKSQKNGIFIDLSKEFQQNLGNYKFILVSFCNKNEPACEAMNINFREAINIINKNSDLLSKSENFYAFAEIDTEKSSEIAGLETFEPFPKLNLYIMSNRLEYNGKYDSESIANYFLKNTINIETIEIK